MARSKEIKSALQDEERYQEQAARIRRLAYRKFQIDDENLLNLGVIEPNSHQPDIQSFDLKSKVDFEEFQRNPDYNAAVIAAIQGALSYMVSSEGVNDLDNPETRSAIERAALQGLFEEDNLQN